MKRFTSFLLLAVMILSLFSGCQEKKVEVPTSEPATTESSEASAVPTTAGNTGNVEPQYGGVLKISVAASPKSLDPKNRTSAYETNVMKQMYDNLLVYAKDDSKIIPSVAKSWEVSKDGLEYTFKLRDDVYFHPGKYQDGRKLTAEDVKFSLERAATEAITVDLLELDHVDVIDETTVKCVLKYPSAIFMDALCAGTQVLVCKEEVEGWGDDYTEHAIGTGPFKLVNFTLDQSIEMTRNDKYWGQKPYLDGVKFFVINDSNQLINGLKSGDLDAVQQVTGEGIKLVKEDPKLMLISRPNNSVSFVGFNLDSEKLKDIRIRQAMIEAVDMKDLVKGVWPNGEATFAGQPIPKASWAYDPSLEDYVPKYDPEHAKELLKEAGYPDGFKMTANFSASEVTTRLATALQSYWKNNLNIDLEVIATKWAPYSEIVTSGKHEIYAVSISVTPDPWYYTGLIMSSKAIGTMRNGVRFNDPALDELLQKSLATNDQAERKQVTKEIVAHAMGMYPALYWCSANINWGVNKKVHDLVPKNEFNLVTSEINVWMEP